MIKHLVTTENSIVEFIVEQDANDWASQHGGVVSSVDETEPTPSAHELALILSARKVERGKTICNEAIIGFGATDATANEVVQMLTDLGPIKDLLETGALGTARDMIGSVISGYSAYASILQNIIDQITEFEAQYGL